MSNAVRVRVNEWDGAVCPTCGAEFALRKSLMEAKQQSGDPLYCPNGHLSKVTPE
jgi:hypothetical protein